MASLLSSSSFVLLLFEIAQVQDEGLPVGVVDFGRFDFLDAVLLAAEHRLFALAMAGSLPLLDHPIVFSLSLLYLQLFLLLSPSCFPGNRLFPLNNLHLRVILSSSAGDISNVLDDETFNLMEQLQGRL